MKNEIKLEQDTLLLQEGKKPLPSYILQLMSLQDRKGKFDHLQDVLVTLGMPIELQWKHSDDSDKYEEYELAGALVIALIRQHTDLFKELVEFHDKTLQWIHSNELIYEARELVNNNFMTIDYHQLAMMSMSGVSTDSGRSAITPNLTLQTGSLQSSTSNISSIQQQDDTSVHQMMMTNTTTNEGFESTQPFQFTTVSTDLKNTAIIENELEDLESLASSVIQSNSISIPGGVQQQQQTSSRPSSPAKEDFSNLLSSLHKFSGAKSEEELNIQKRIVSELEVRLLCLVFSLC